MSIGRFEHFASTNSSSYNGGWNLINLAGIILMWPILIVTQKVSVLVAFLGHKALYYTCMANYCPTLGSPGLRRLVVPLSCID